MAALLERLSNLLENIPFGKKVAILALLTLAIAGTILMVVWARHPDFQILYSNLSYEDSAEIVSRLQQNKIPYKVTANGSTVMAPSKNVYELRMQMASDGFPQGGGIGYEIFDKTSFGVTEFVQKINFKRALQRELERTINNLAEVEHSRIHIVTPEKALFVEDQTKTTASIMLKLKGGRRLKSGQINGIVHLVSSSVEGLNPEDVTVIDVHGEMLYGGQANSPVERLTTSQFDYKTGVEKSLAMQVQSMMDKVVGPHNAIVRISAELNFQQIEKTEESFDPASQVARSEQRTEESSQGGGVSGGIAGFESNVPGGDSGGVGGGGSQSTRTKETINYELNKVVKRIIEPVGTIKKLSVSLVVNGSYEGEEKTYKPRTAEEMKQFENILKTTVGYDESRGDEIKVETIQFNKIDFSEEEKILEEAAKKEQYFIYGKYAAAGIIAIMLFMLIIRPLMKWVTEMGAGYGLELPGGMSPMAGGTAAAGAAAEAAENIDPIDVIQQTKGQEYRKRVQELADADPERTAELVRKWMHGSTVPTP